MLSVFPQQGNGIANIRALSLFNVKNFGAVGNSIADDKQAFDATIAAAAAADGTVYVPSGTYRIGSQLVLPANCTIVGTSRTGSILLNDFNTDSLFSVNDDNQFHNMKFDGLGATHGASRLFTIAGTKARTYWSNCDIVDSGGYAVEWLNATAGSQSNMIGCTVYRVGGDYAIKNEDVQQLIAVPKKFIACESNGGKFIDFGGTNDTTILGGYIGGVKYSTFTSGTIVEARIGDALGITIDGSNNQIIGGPIAGPVGGPCLTVAATAIGCKVAASFNSTNPVLDLSTASGANLNQIDIPWSTWTPTVTSSGAAVNLGAGATITAGYCRQGGVVTIQISLTWGGAGRSIPVGFLEFSLPASIVPRTADVATQHGSGYAQQGGTTKLLTCVAFAPPGFPFVRAVTEGGGFLTNINPFVWNTNDAIRLSNTFDM